MRKSLHQGTKDDVIALRAKQLNVPRAELANKIADAITDYEKQLRTGATPYQALVAMDSKITRIVTFNHSWVNQC